MSLFLAQLKSWAEQELEYCWVSLHLNENSVIIYPPSCCSKTFWKKFWSYVKVSKWWQNSHVWVNYGTMCLYLRRLFLTSLSLQEEEFFKKWWPLKKKKKCYCASTCLKKFCLEYTVYKAGSSFQNLETLTIFLFCRASSIPQQCTISSRTLSYVTLIFTGYLQALI